MDIVLGILGLAFWGLLFIGYFLPAVIAMFRGHRNLGPIIIINVFFGWTLVGWVGAFAWSCSSIQEKS